MNLQALSQTRWKHLFFLLHLGILDGPTVLPILDEPTGLESNKLKMFFLHHLGILDDLQSWESQMNLQAYWPGVQQAKSV